MVDRGSFGFRVVLVRNDRMVFFHGFSKDRLIFKFNWIFISENRLTNVALGGTSNVHQSSISNNATRADLAKKTTEDTTN
jgi:hypothetical protein